MISGWHGGRVKCESAKNVRVNGRVTVKIRARASLFCRFRTFHFRILYISSADGVLDGCGQSHMSL